MTMIGLPQRYRRTDGQFALAIPRSATLRAVKMQLSLRAVRGNNCHKRSLTEVYLHFYQRVSIASYASAGIARGGMSVCPSVCPSVRLSVTLRYCIKTKKASVMISSPSESLNILISRNIWFITKLDRGHPERG